ncbi:hypothetical protein B0H14DRAFT_2758491 [Mycena olivaceomarginata]|nr:hypothetical protein B0H14DRAFT_2758491 [Mycena olivaceomarginata]
MLGSAGRACMVAVGIGVARSCILSCCGGAALTALTLRACGVAPVEGSASGHCGTDCGRLRQQIVLVSATSRSARPQFGPAGRRNARSHAGHNLVREYKMPLRVRKFAETLKLYL